MMIVVLLVAIVGLSAFNVQCDNEILKVNFSNIDRAQEKLEKIRNIMSEISFEGGND